MSLRRGVETCGLWWDGVVPEGWGGGEGRDGSGGMAEMVILLVLEGAP